MRRDPWLATAVVITVVYAVFWALDPPGAASVGRLGSPLVRTAALVGPVVLVTALGCRYLAARGFGVGWQWATVVVAAVWTSLAGAAQAFWSGAPRCGVEEHRSCSTTGPVRIACLLVVLAMWLAARSVTTPRAQVLP